jgi:O-6-methylguanine DNA methyltransferase
MAFADRVHAFVRTVPRGRVVTYGDVAFAIGSPGAARAVGTVMANTPSGSKTPCHRVVDASGRVPRNEHGPALAVRLRKEGIKVTRDGQLHDFPALRWTGAREP